MEAMKFDDKLSEALEVEIRLWPIIKFMFRRSYVRKIGQMVVRDYVLYRFFEQLEEECRKEDL